MCTREDGPRIPCLSERWWSGGGGGMRYHKEGLSALASLPSHQFDREGLLLLRERHDSFFRRTEVSSERWCRLRGNFLFYLKTRDHWSEASGVVVLEHCSVTVEGNAPHAFTILFGGGGGAQVCEASSEADRDAWVATIRRCAPAALRAQNPSMMNMKKHDLRLLMLHEFKLGHNASKASANINEHGEKSPQGIGQYEGGSGNSGVVMRALKMKRSSNPDFLSTVVLGGDDSVTPGGAVDSSCRVRIVVRRVLDPLSHTSTIIGTAVTSVAVVRSSRSLRLSLVSLSGETAGFVSLTCWRADMDVGSARDVPAALHTLQSTPTHAAHLCPSWRHRRTQSLPPRLSAKSRLPQPPPLCPFHTNPTTATYRFHSGLGGDIAVVEVMAESRLSLTLPQQLLKIWQGAERAWQEELEALGVLAEPWLSRQCALVAMHSSRSQLYEDAAAVLTAYAAKGFYFKRSADKEDPQLEFAPINLHLQRVWGQNESLKRAGFHDVHTVGAFAANALGCGHGGLLTQLQDQSRRDRGEASTRVDCSRAAVESTRRLRSALASSLNALLSALHGGGADTLLEHLADVREKIDLVLSSLEADVVEAAFDFLDQIKIPQSPSHLITLASRNYSVHSNLSGYLSPESSLDKTIGQHLRKPDDVPQNSTEADCCDSVLLDRRRDTAVDRTPDVRLSHTSESEINYSNVGTSSYDHGGIIEAKYYCATDEPEPWDLIKLNLQASFICLSSKVKAIYNSRCQKKTCSTSKNALAPLAQIDGFSEMSAVSHDALTVQTNSADVSPTEDDSGIGLERSTPDSERRLNDAVAAVKCVSSDTVHPTLGTLHTAALGKPHSTANGVVLSPLDCREYLFLGGSPYSSSLETKSGFTNQYEQIVTSVNGSGDERTSRSKLTSILETSKENILDGESISSPSLKDFQSLSAPVSSIDGNSVENVSRKETCGRISSRYVDSDLSSVCDATGNLESSRISEDADESPLIHASLPSLSTTSLENVDGRRSEEKRNQFPADVPMHSSSTTTATYNKSCVVSSKSNPSFCVVDTSAPRQQPYSGSVNLSAVSPVDKPYVRDVGSSELPIKANEESAVALVVPSIIKLRGAVDGAVRTARLVHSLHKLQLPTDAVHKTHALQYRRDVCFAQALTTAVSGLVSCLWSRAADATLLTVLQQLGPLLQFEGLLSCYCGDGARLSDMIVAVEDLATVQFVLVPTSVTDMGTPDAMPKIAVTGNRCGLRVLLPVPESLLCLLPDSGCDQPLSFHITPVFFNIGINEEATLAGKLRMEGPQHRNNLDSFRRLAEYHHRYAKLDLPSDTSRRGCWNSNQPTLSELMDKLSRAVRASKSKNTEVLHLAAAVTRAMGGVRFTSCKSGKDRTGMSVTLEQVNFLTAEFDLARPERHQSLQAMRSDGTRIINCQKNINVKKFAFNTMQLAMFPRDYAPPPGSYGASVT
ncbi:Pleckstrin domain [Trinorchestia longiramus]|nr:Pleckstrin domain [Trinorchestia longiramus]